LAKLLADLRACLKSSPCPLGLTDASFSAQAQA